MSEVKICVKCRRQLGSRYRLRGDGLIEHFECPDPATKPTKSTKPTKRSSPTKPVNPTK